ncbi:DUF4294 domain-containing protein [Pedobacter sp. HMF7647]|uniref:DUF4294 domain-containing protein n=1 Tax=Hufsiella arboris TaxID=2695275 RepID=A0A7K1YAE4_9SPHI|nr:DUF4294 domain-containing protein [Hufsiella arboris]MXV51341.1 DUF4294 domain-containing protein [Hufsiella arboris]
MKIFRLIAFFFLILCADKLSAQDLMGPNGYGKNDTIRVAMTNANGVMIPWLPLSEVPVYGKRFLTPEQRIAYNRLRYNVLKVLPYAVFARDRYSQLQRDLAVTGDKREQKKLVKACEQQIKGMFNKEIKNLTITQGEILIKLIDRETGNSTFELVRQLRGGFTAFSYQLVASVFGHDLKEKYDPQEQRDIEAILATTNYYTRNNY